MLELDGVWKQRGGGCLVHIEGAVKNGSHNAVGVLEDGTAGARFSAKMIVVEGKCRMDLSLISVLPHRRECIVLYAYDHVDGLINGLVV